MDRPQSLGLGEAISAFPQPRGNLLLEPRLNDLQSPVHQLADRILSQPLGQGINRKDSGILGPFLSLFVGFDLKIRCLEKALASLESAPYPKSLSRLKNPGKIVPSETEERALGPLVLDRHLQCFIVPSADPCPGAYLHQYIHPIRSTSIFKAILVTAILIAARIVAQQLFEGSYTETLQAPSQHRPYAAKLLDRLLVLM
jgi:hypothetical protein